MSGINFQPGSVGIVLTFFIHNIIGNVGNNIKPKTAFPGTIKFRWGSPVRIETFSLIQKLDHQRIIFESDAYLNGLVRNASIRMADDIGDHFGYRQLDHGYAVFVQQLRKDSDAAIANKMANS